MIVGFWIKYITSVHPWLIELYIKTKLGEIDFPLWLIITRTALHSKNERTKEAKNYRPIACQNILFKIYTGILNSFVQDHCQSNDIIADEQAGGKGGSWGCIDQLLINKAIN